VLFNDGGLFYGKVVDFIDIDFFSVSLFGYHLSRWPIFNIADSSVTVGVLILLIFHRSFVIEEEEIGKPSLEPAPASPESPPKVRS